MLNLVSAEWYRRSRYGFKRPASGQPHPRRNAVTTSPDKKDILRSGAPAGCWAAMREFNRGVAL